MNMMNSAQDKAIVRATIELAHNLELDVVAEGVENEETLRRLGGLACEQAQGYFISEPISAASLAEWYGNYEPVRYDERRKRHRAFADSA
jgi:EAL domain-containing protein (putative c-di-GMP-specific phosphodiesterase class I)